MYTSELQKMFAFQTVLLFHSKMSVDNFERIQQLCFDKAKDTLPPPCPLIAIHFCEVLDGPKLRHLPRFNETENDKWYQQYLENGI